jgi:glycosyltransferase involved in cell wall biosynthesis
MLYIAGDGAEKENLKNIIQKNNLQERVKLLGFLNENQMKEVIRKCKFVVVPSIWYENCPYSVMETLAIGKTVVGANIGGIPELVKNEKSGLTYKYDDVDELADKMKTLFDNKNLVNQYGENAKKQAKNEYGKEEYYQKIIGIYERLKN